MAAMTLSESKPVPGEAEAREQAEAAARGPASQMLERLAGSLGGNASAKAVYGEPVHQGDITVIPVASVRFAFGGGEGSGEKAAERSRGGGGGGGVTAKPIGYIEISNGTAVYKPIRDPLTDVWVPVALAVIGAAAPRAFRKLRTLRQSRH